MAAALLVVSPAALAAEPCDRKAEVCAGPRDLYLQVSLNGDDTGLIAEFRQLPNGMMTSTVAELAAVGLDRAKLAAAGASVTLADVPGLTFDYNESRQTIHLWARPALLRTARLDAGPRARETDAFEPATGVVLNYAVFGSSPFGADSGGRAAPSLAGALGLRGFSADGAWSSNFIAGGSARVGSLVRLDSMWSYSDPQNLVVYRAGDVLARGPNWSQSVMLGGVQIARRFDLRSDIITTPVPLITGSVESPSTLDLYVNGIRTMSAQVPAGPFAIDRAPVVLGGGITQVVTRDAIGREVITSFPFYTSAVLLAPGLSDFSVEAGLVRKNFGVDSFAYAAGPVASASVRRGLEGGRTLEAHAELSERMVSLGVGGAARLEKGVLSLGLAASHAGSNTGGLVDVGWESRFPGFSFTAHSRRVWGEFDDIASSAQHKAQRGPALRPTAIDQVGVSTGLPALSGRLGVNYSRIVDPKERLSIVGASYGQDIGKVFLNASVSRDFQRSRSTAVYVSLTMPLGARTSASVGASSDPRGNRTTVEVSRSEDMEGGSAWHIQAAQGEKLDAQGGVSFRGQYGRVEGSVRQYGDRGAISAQAEGSLALIDGRMFAASRIDRSFALVDAGASGVSVRRENRETGKTDRRGLLLVPDLVAYETNSLDLDPTNLPVDAEMLRTHAVVVPTDSAGALVRFSPAIASASAVIVLVDPGGAPLAPGSRGWTGDGSEVVVGYDGEAFVRGLKAANTVEIEVGDGACRAAFEFSGARGQRNRLENVVCRPTARARPPSIVPNPPIAAVRPSPRRSIPARIFGLLEQTLRTVSSWSLASLQPGRPAGSAASLSAAAPA
ncbi:fimbrial biogenesis outer membrane usher protein [soil metagenome]